MKAALDGAISSLCEHPYTSLKADGPLGVKWENSNQSTYTNLEISIKP